MKRERLGVLRVTRITRGIGYHNVATIARDHIDDLVLCVCVYVGLCMCMRVCLGASGCFRGDIIVCCDDWR